jgi:hypothetical protein
MSGDPVSDDCTGRALYRGGPPPPTVGGGSGQLVRRETPPAPVQRPTGAVVRASTGPRAPRGWSVVHVVGVARQAVTHERTTAAVRWLARNLVLYVLAGARIVVRRLWEARTNSRYERLTMTGAGWTGSRRRSWWCAPPSSRS